MSDNNEWDAIDGFEGWAARLEQLLAEAEAAVKTDDIDRRVEVQRKLRQFRHHSPNTYCQKLDAIALQAIEDSSAPRSWKACRRSASAPTS